MPTPNPMPPHHDGNGRFRTPGSPPMFGMRDALKLNFGKEGRTRGHWPRWVDITPRPLPPRPAPGSGSGEVVATWINHSTFLIQTADANIVTDPVFSRCCGPFGRLGPSRAHAPGVALEALPRIDIVLLSHDHYDHCDLQALRFLARRDAPLAVTPLGNGPLFRRAGFARERVAELDWWQVFQNANFRITLTPAQHWSKRLSSGARTRLWGGFYIDVAAASGGRRVYFAGDSGYHATIFRDIAARLGSPDLAFLPIGAYEPRWFMSPQHCNPAEAVQIHRDLGARQSVAMHWGTFRLTDEARDEPPRALAAALASAGISPGCFKVLEPGESLAV